MRTGILTSGGDCPGLNAAIRAATRRLISRYDGEVLGIRNGFSGLVSGEVEPLSLYSVSGILPKGGTILGTSRMLADEVQRYRRNVTKTLEKFEIEALIVIGDGSALEAAHALARDGVHSVCIPTTIDNDIVGTDMTFGFDTAVSIATEAIDRIHSTADSHHRVMVIEVMGHDSGWIATMAGLAGGADCILIPEVPFRMTEVADLLKKRHRRKKFSIMVVAEGVAAKLVPAGGGETHIRSAADFVGRELEEITGMETRVAILGHIQRGGTPTAHDRILATRFGVRAADMVANLRYDLMTALRGTEIQEIPVAEVAGKTRPVDAEIYEIASVFFG